MQFSTPARTCCLLLSIVVTTIFVTGCASRDNRYKLPPPRNTQALPTAHGSVYGKQGAELPVNPTNRCITSAGHCLLPAPTETGLPCTCDSTNPEFTYGGSTGPIPPMPDWADPNLKHTN